MARWDTAIQTVDGGHGATAAPFMTAEDMYEAGLRYSAGRGVPTDLVAAHMWFNLAASRGHDVARSLRTEIANELSRKDVALAQRKAREWLKAPRTSA